MGLIKDINDKTPVFVKGLVTKVEEKEGKRGPYTAVTLTDGEQEVTFNKWCRKEEFDMEGMVLEVELISRGGYVNINSYNFSTDSKPEDFVRRAPIDVDKVYEEMIDEISKFSSPDLRKVVYTIIDRRKTEFKTWAAAKSMHHNYIGGLIYHSYRMMKTALALSEIYNLNKDILVAGVLLHDIAKIREFSMDALGKTEYTVEGDLFGHLYMGAKTVADTCKELGIDENKEEMFFLIHEILSHHGKQEFGAVRPPMTKEAMVLSVIDALDADIWKYEYILSNMPEPEGEHGIMSGFEKMIDGAVYKSPAVN